MRETLWTPLELPAHDSLSDGSLHLKVPPEARGACCRTAKDILFGYSDPLLSTVKTLLPGFRTSDVSIVPMTSRRPASNVSGPSGEPQTTKMATGEDESQPNWTYRRWRGLQEIGCWPGHSEVINGTSDGSYFRPGLRDKDELSVFVPELFRKVKLKATGKVRLCMHTLRNLIVVIVVHAFKPLAALKPAATWQHAAWHTAAPV